MNIDTLNGFCNYHTHTNRCRHASNSDEEYIKKAIFLGYKELGFTDHTPWPFIDGYHSNNVRMMVDELAEYTESIRNLSEKYKDKIKIYVGLECEYYPEYYSWLKTTKESLGLDYLILGNHFKHSDENDCRFTNSETSEELEEYMDGCIAGMQSGLFDYLAHADLALANYPSFDDSCAAMAEKIGKASIDYHCPLEYNLLGIIYCSENRYHGLGYPCHDFWRTVGSMHCEAIVGVDAHTVDQLNCLERVQHAYNELETSGCVIRTSLY